MVLPRQYLRVGQSARNRLFGIGANSNSADYSPLQMLISQQGQINRGRLACITIAVCAIILGFLLSSVPWVDYLILNDLRLRNGSLSFQYWQKPGVIRLTKVYIFNITNPESFLKHKEKPKLVEVGPFVYMENMEKINVKFNKNGTVSYQHKKILQFVPELSLPCDMKIVVPNIPLLALSDKLESMSSIVQFTVNLILKGMGYNEVFKTITVNQLMFGYQDGLITIAKYVYLSNQKPLELMGLLIGRNGTLPEIHTIHTGKNMSEFGYLSRLNGLETLPEWHESPCNELRASEGSFFPPRDYTKSDTVYVYDKDVCRILPLTYKSSGEKDDVPVDLYTMSDKTFESATKEPRNACFCRAPDDCPEKGLQNISPCQFDAPVYLSQPHFLDADPDLIDKFEGLRPNRTLHTSYFKIQPKLGVPLEGKIRVQLNLRVKKNRNFNIVSDFPSITYPIIWLEEGIDKVSPSIQRWIYLATVIPDSILPIITYGMIVFGTLTLIIIFIKTHRNVVFNQRTLEIGMRTITRHSSLLLSMPSRIVLTESETLLNNDSVTDV